MVFDFPLKDRIYYMGEAIKLVLSVVTIGHIKKSLMRGATAYLIVMTSTTEEPKGVQGILIVSSPTTTVATNLQVKLYCLFFLLCCCQLAV